MSTEPDDVESLPPGPDLPPTAHGAHGDGEDAELNAELALELDPELLAAALEAVSPKARAPVRPAPRKPEAPDPHILALHARLREQADRMAVLEGALERAESGRSEAESQLAELRTAARAQVEDFDRFRQRTRKEREDAEKAGAERVLRQFVDTAENMERAWQHAQANPDKLLSGLQMIVDQFRSALRKSGVERIPAGPGTPFDPERHEAVLHVPTDAHPPGHVVDEAAPGFWVHGRLFRAARVTVSAAMPAAVTFPDPSPSAPAPGDGTAPSSEPAE